MLKLFDKLGRSLLVKLNKGGWFLQRYTQLSRDCFRVVGFLSRNCGHGGFMWEHDYRPSTNRTQCVAIMLIQGKHIEPGI